jgi:hypothetical protein
VLASDFEAFWALRLISIAFIGENPVIDGGCAYRFEDILVYSFVAERFQMIPVVSRFPCTGTTTENDKFHWVLAGKGFGFV